MVKMILYLNGLVQFKKKPTGPDGLPTGSIDWVKILYPTGHKISDFGEKHSSQPITEKLNQTQQNQGCICNKIHYNIKEKQKTVCLPFTFGLKMEWAYSKKQITKEANK